MFMVRWLLSDKPVNEPAKSLSTHKATESKLPINPNPAESKDILVPGDVINIMLGYANLEVSGHIQAVVSTLFNH